MKIAPIKVFQDFDINIDLYELIYWSIFFFFVEYLFPILVDPLSLSIEIFGYELDELFELIILLILPFFITYYGDIVSGFNYIFAFFFYGLLTAPLSTFLIHDIFSDVLGIIFILIFIDELFESQIDNEGDLSDDAEDFSEHHIEKI